MEINICPADIDKYVKDAILESTLGKTIKEELNKALKDLFSGYRNPVDGIVKEELRKIVIEYMNQDDTKPLILEAIAKWVTPEMVSKLVEYGAQKFKSEYDDYRSN